MPFANEPVLELRRATVRAGLADALAAHDARGALRVPVWIGEDRREGEELVSTDPGRPDRVVATAAAARPEEVDAALAAARPWSAPAQERAQVLRRAAQWLREHRLEVAALAVRECAKPWPEPVKAIVCTRGSRTSAAPTLPSPGSRERAAGGTPASRSARTRTSAQPGACSAGLSTTALPVASPAAAIPHGIATGKFHGEITATTPRAAQRSSLRSPGGCSSGAPWARSIAPRA